VGGVARSCRCSVGGEFVCHFLIVLKEGAGLGAVRFEEGSEPIGVIVMNPSFVVV
jgi:hypothetical protein